MENVQTSSYRLAGTAGHEYHDDHTRSDSPSEETTTQRARQNMGVNAHFQHKMRNWEYALDAYMGTNRLQALLDGFGRDVQGLLDEVGAGADLGWTMGIRTGLGPLADYECNAWYEKLALSLIKLPFRAAYNILCLIYSIVKTIATTVVHPLRAIIHLFKFIGNLVNALQKPETWSNMGAGIIGASLGQMAITGGLGPHAYLGLMFGTSVLVTGLAIGAISAAVNAIPGLGHLEVERQIKEQIKAVPECMATGFLVGLTMAAAFPSLSEETTTQISTNVAAAINIPVKN